MTGSLEPIVWRITCCASECDPERFRPVTRPIDLKGDRASVMRQLKKLGWQQTPSLPGRKPSIYWWCPRHAQAGGAA